MVKVTGPTGQVRIVPAPTKHVLYQGTDLTIKGLKISLQESQDLSADRTTSREYKLKEGAEQSGSDASKTGSKTGEEISAEIGEFSLLWKTREVTELAAILDYAQYNNNVMLVASAASDTDIEYRTKLASLAEAQQKLDQLALIASTKDSVALNKWISYYFEGRRLNEQRPVTNTTLGLGTF
jgi:hypothetical protein